MVWPVAATRPTSHGLRPAPNAATLTAPGDRVAFEAVTYASLARAANLIGRRPVSVPMTGDGIDVEAFDQ